MGCTTQPAATAAAADARAAKGKERGKPRAEPSAKLNVFRWRARGRVVSGPDRPNGVPSYPDPPRPAAPPCAAPTRPARGVSGFWIRQVIYYVTCRVQNPDIPRAGRVGAHSGVAGRGRAALDTNRTIRLKNKPHSYPPKHRRHVA